METIIIQIIKSVFCVAVLIQIVSVAVLLLIQTLLNANNVILVL